MCATKRLSGIILLLTVLIGDGGCGLYHVEATSYTPTQGRITYPTIVVLPPNFMMEHRPHQVFQYTYDLIEVLTSDHDMPTVAPWEYDRSGTMFGSTRDVLRAITYLNLEAAELVVLDFRLEEEMSSRTIAAPFSMGGGIELIYESDMTVTLSLRTFPESVELATVSIEFSDEPFAEGSTMANPRPLLRAAVRRAASELAALLEESWLDPVMGPCPDLDVRFNPVEMFRYEGGAGEPLEADFAAMDELDRLAYSIGYYEYFEADVSAGTVSSFESLPAGLLVEAVGPGCEACGLVESDFIIAVNGQSAAGPQSLLRPFLNAREGGSAVLTVLRDGEEREVRVAVSTVD